MIEGGLDPDDPDQCIFDIWSLVRYAPGTEPPLERKVYKSMEGHSAGGILDQDIRNITYRRSDGRFCIIDFEFATILDGGDGKPISLKPTG